MKKRVFQMFHFIMYLAYNTAGFWYHASREVSSKSTDRDVDAIHMFSNYYPQIISPSLKNN